MSATDEGTLEGGAARDDAPTPAERLALVRAYQRQALTRADPLAANLGTIAGDLMSFAHGLASLVRTPLAPGAVPEEGRQRFVEDAELYLKVVRQLDRLAQIERQRGARGRDRPRGP